MTAAILGFAAVSVDAQADLLPFQGPKRPIVRCDLPVEAVDKAWLAAAKEGLGVIASVKFTRLTRLQLSFLGVQKLEDGRPAEVYELTGCYDPSSPTRFPQSASKILQVDHTARWIQVRSAGNAIVLDRNAVRR
jgi:hypothetical protein